MTNPVFHRNKNYKWNFCKAVTQKPAEAIKKETEIGSLSIGAEADVTILRLVDAKDTTIGEKSEDSNGNVKMLKKRIIPLAVFRAGTLYVPSFKGIKQLSFE